MQKSKQKNPQELHISWNKNACNFKLSKNVIVKSKLKEW